MDLTLTDDQEQKRYLATVDGQPAGHVAYIRAPDLIVFTHTEVDPQFEGKGVGSALARAVLDQARADRIAVLPLCPFISGWIGRHPDYQDVVYQAPHSKVTD